MCRHRSPKLNRVFLLLMLAVLFFTVGSGAADEDFSVSRIGHLISFAENAFLVKSRHSGKLTISIHDEVSVYRTLEREISAGETRIEWDGCGYNREKLTVKTYTVTSVLQAENGETYQVSFLSPVEYTGQALQYALPSSSTLFADHAEEWFLEYKTVMKGTVQMELYRTGEEACAASCFRNTIGGKLYRLSFDTLFGSNPPDPGRYEMVVYEASRKEEVFRFPLRIQKQKEEPPSLFLTGEIMPRRGISEAELWALMQSPSIVVDIDFFDHQKVFSLPDTQSAVLGTLHGQTQALKTLEIRDDWTRIGAWNHEEGEYVEGWVPTAKLKVVSPQEDYGILIDKKEQTLTVYCKGKKLDTLTVSTGRPEKKALFQETTAGCFLTGYHRVDFSTNGKKYDYVIQYDGGNLLHQLPYEWGAGKKDFTLGRAYLGAKASHACIRIQAEPGAGGLNAYWLWTHIPFHTRVIILDDPEERAGLIGKLKRQDEDFREAAGHLNLVRSESLESGSADSSVVLSFCGNLIAGGKRSFNARNDSFISVLRNAGARETFASLLPLLEQDDLTCISLSCPLADPSGDRSDLADIGFAPSDCASLFGSLSAELVCIDEKSAGFENSEMIAETEANLQGIAGYIDSAQIFTTELKGRLFGFASVSEKEYLKNPSCISRQISLLRKEGCEKIIVICNWGGAKESVHSVIQEAMGRKCVQAGADLVVGCHPHMLQGIDDVNGTPVVYSLGDLLDGSTTKSPGSSGAILRVVFPFDGEASDPLLTWIPLSSSREKNPSSGNPYAPLIPGAYEDLERTAQLIWNDSPADAFEKTSFLQADQ